MEPGDHFLMSVFGRGKTKGEDSGKGNKHSGKGNKHRIGRKELLRAQEVRNPGEKAKESQASVAKCQDPGWRVNMALEPRVLRGSRPCPVCFPPLSLLDLDHSGKKSSRQIHR